ncbi:hypothetical protein KQX54_004559 [Cotesia glomerata]|uniref:Uncharacterized protein n=1 Tax=Cotesia glomerata TaxID=32391 RepID=A0AAV7J2J9_COTGL|nr:hypothetical protein KQX54_004559 [Cotesia glomerata]
MVSAITASIATGRDVRRKNPCQLDRRSTIVYHRGPGTKEDCDQSGEIKSIESAMINKKNILLQQKLKYLELTVRLNRAVLPPGPQKETTLA